MLDPLASEHAAMAAVSAIPGVEKPRQDAPDSRCVLPNGSRLIALRPTVSPGLPAELAWTLSGIPTCSVAPTWRAQPR